MTEQEGKYYEELKANPKDWNFDSLFNINDKGEAITKEGLWFRLMSDNLPIFFPTTQKRIDLLNDVTTSTLQNKSTNALNSFSKMTSIFEDELVTNPIVGDSIFKFEQDAGIDSKLGNWADKALKTHQEAFGEKLKIKYISQSDDEQNYKIKFEIISSNLKSKNAVLILYKYSQLFSSESVDAKHYTLNKSSESINFTTSKSKIISGEKYYLKISCGSLAEETGTFILKNSVNNSIIVHGVKYDYNEIKRRVDLIKKKLTALSSKLTEEEKTILNLPLLEWNLGFRHGAVMSIHWLEATKKSIKLDYNFFVSGNRLENIDIINLKSYFEHLEYLCEQNLGYSPSNPDGIWQFLYNDSIPAIKKSKDLFLKQIGTLEKSTNFGDYDDLSKVIEKPKVKNNLFQSFDIGSVTGDLDDAGAALGRFSLRCYFKGILNKNDQSGGVNWFLNIEEIGVRFVDEFSFNDPKKEFLSPGTWFSQPLGYWKNDINNPDVSTKPLIGYIGLSNEDFINLKEKAKKNGITIGGDFLIYSDIKKISDEFVKKTILVY